MKGAVQKSLPQQPKRGSGCIQTDIPDDAIEDWQTDELYRGITARINYLSMDRPDLQYSSKGASQYMANPCPLGWQRLKRIGKYSLRHPILIQTFPFGAGGTHITADGDSDWAGDKSTRKSTSGGTLRLGSHLIKSWSSTQQTISLSSAEAELYAMCKASIQAIGLAQLLKDFGKASTITVQSDSSAALAIVQREGLGRTRHI